MTVGETILAQIVNFSVLNIRKSSKSPIREEMDVNPLKNETNIGFLRGSHWEKW